MSIPAPRELLRRTGITLLGVLALALPLYVAVVTRTVRLGGLGRGDLVPWYSQWDPRLSAWTLLAAGAALAVGILAPRVLAARSPARFALATVGLVTCTWAAIALSDGGKVGEARSGPVDTDGLSYPFERTAHEYIGDVPKVDAFGVRGLLEAWPTEAVQNTLAWHSRTHPPGAVLLLAAIADVGGSGALPAAVSVLLLGGLAVLVAWRWARLHLAPADARLAALLFAFAPGTTLFFATSMETVFTLLQLTALLAMSISLRSRLDAAGVARALTAGAALALATFFTYASLLVVIWTAAFEGVRLVRGRDPRGPAGTAAILATQVVGFALGIAALRVAGWDALASVRAAMAADAMVMPSGGGLAEWAATGTANLLAWGVGAGLATLAMAGSLLRNRTGPRPDLAAGLALTLGVAAFSTLFTLEVERIWVPLTLPLVVTIVAAAGSGSAPARGDGAGDPSGSIPAALATAWLGLLVLQSVATEILAETRW